MRSLPSSTVWRASRSRPYAIWLKVSRKHRIPTKRGKWRMTDLALDLEHLRKDAARWPEFGSSVADLAGSGTALNYTGSGELDLIDEFLNAYNTLCAKF